MKHEIVPVQFINGSYIKVNDDKQATYFGLYEDDEWLCDCRDRETANRISFALEYYKDIKYNTTLKERITYEKRITA